MKFLSAEKNGRDFSFLHGHLAYFFRGRKGARVVKLADTQDLGSCAARREGSTPSSSTSGNFWKKIAMIFCQFRKIAHFDFQSALNIYLENT